MFCSIRWHPCLVSLGSVGQDFVCYVQDCWWYRSLASCVWDLCYVMNADVPVKGLLLKCLSNAEDVQGQCFINTVICVLYLGSVGHVWVLTFSYLATISARSFANFTAASWSEAEDTTGGRREKVERGRERESGAERWRERERWGEKRRKMEGMREKEREREEGRRERKRGREKWLLVSTASCNPQIIQNPI